MKAQPPCSPQRRPDTGPSSLGIIEAALRRNEGQPQVALAAHGRPPARGKEAPHRGRIPLVDADPELAAAVPSEDLPRARRALRATVSHHNPGPVTMPEPPSTAFGLLVVAGAATAEVRLTPAARMIELLLPGDILSPRPASFCLPDHQGALTALPAGLSLAVLDHRFVEAATTWPGLMTAVHQRLHDQAHRLAVHAAICQLPRIEDRVMAILSHLAGRIGKVTPEGIVVPLALRHEDLAGYVGARRPSVSLAIKMLRAQGRLDRRADETWLLPPSPVRPQPEE